MLSIRSNVITLTRGDNAHFEISVTLQDGQSYDMVDGDMLQFCLKKNSKDTVELLRKTFTEPEFELVPEDTKDLDFGTYVYDIEIQLATGEVYTIIPISNFIIAEEVG